MYIRNHSIIILWNVRLDLREPEIMAGVNIIQINIM